MEPLPALSLVFEGSTVFVANARLPTPRRLKVQCPAGLPAGAQVRVLLGNFRSFRDGESDRHWSLQGAQVEEGAGRVRISQNVPVHLHELVAAQVSQRPFRSCLCQLAIEADIAPGAAVVLDWLAMLSPHAWFDAVLEVQARVGDGSAWQGVGPPITLSNIAGAAQALELRPGAPAADGSVAMTIFACDSAGNPVHDYTGSIRFEPEPALQGLPPAVAIGPGDRGVIRLEGLRVIGPGPVRLRASDDHGRQALSPPILGRPLGNWRQFFGEFHWHTDFSADGDNSLENAYRYARDYLNLDVAAVSDHTPGPQQWQETQQINARFHEPGRFVTIPAWEWSTSHGHANLYLRHPETDAAPTRKYDAAHPAAQEWPADVVLIPHHTNIRAAQRKPDGNPWWYEYDWSLANNRLRLVEIVQARGNFESDELDADWGVVTGGIGASVRDALAMGHRVGFVGGTDNHTGYPTRNPLKPGSYIGMTGVLAQELTREAIWQALDQRRTYATSGLPILCHFEINAAVMGQEIPWSPGQTVRCSAQLHGCGPIAQVQIISAGYCVWEDHPQRCDVELTDVELPSPAGPWAYYYLRLRQADGHRAWTSPIWLDRRAN